IITSSIHILHLLPSQYYSDHPSLHSFPTRRSSDLILSKNFLPCSAPFGTTITFTVFPLNAWNSEFSNILVTSCIIKGFLKSGLRSEEHTSELQSRFDLVCRLLLEKKKISKYEMHID